MIQIGITERGDAAINTDWKTWVYSFNKPAILITKNPIKLIEENQDLFFSSNGNVILHATITGMGGSWLEPNVLDSDYTIQKLQEFLDNGFNRKRIVIRQDPIFVPEILINDDEYKNKIFRVGRFAKENDLRYRMSFMDLYQHVKDRLYKANPEHYEAILKLQPVKHLSTKIRLKFLEILKSNTGLTNDDIEICGEPDIKCTGCISKKDLDIFGIELEKEAGTGFQRPTCACLGIKKELLNNKHRCAHQCLYCFWRD